MNVTIDGQVYDTDTLTEEAKVQINSLQLADTRLSQLKRDIAMVMTARNVYAQQLRIELAKTQEGSSVDLTKNQEIQPKTKAEKVKSRKLSSTES